MSIGLSRTFLRYAAVGVLTNFAGYPVYLGITFAGVGPKTTASALYAFGALASYMGNRQWAFQHQGRMSVSLARFILAHLFGFALNVGLLFVFVDRLGYPHQLVQAAAICVVAIFLFAVLKLFVFVGPKHSPSS